MGKLVGVYCVGYGKAKLVREVDWVFSDGVELLLVGG